MGELNRKKLSIEILQSGIFHATQTISTTTSTAWKNWQAYRGNEKLSEELFFLIAGYEDEATMARKYHTTTNVLLFGGILGVGTGLGLLFYSFYNRDSAALRWIGAGTLSLGSVPLVFSIGRHNWAPVLKAEEIKDEYNEKLLESVK